MKITIVYTTDFVHSYASRDVIGVVDFEDDEGFITHGPSPLELIKTHAEKHNITLSKDDEFNIINIKQTQGCNAEWEYYIEDVELNKLL